MIGQRHARSLRTATAALVVLAATSALTAARPAAPHPSLDGTWRTDGYGRIVTVHDGRLRTYDISAAGCLPGLISGTRTGPVGPDGAVEFTVDGQPELTLRPRGRDRAVWNAAADVTDIRMRRLAVLPASCATPVRDDPRAVFDVFWATFHENYPFFAAKGVDWEQVRDRHRPRVTARTTDAQLLAILSDMVRPLADAHVGIRAGATGSFWQPRPGTLPVTDDTFVTRAWQATGANLGAGLRTWAQGKIGYADLPGGVGYLRITSFQGYTDQDAYAADAAELDRALDAVLTPGAAPHGLVLDLRLNGGGSDRLALRLAARLTARPFTAYAKQARTDTPGPVRFTPPQPVTVTPAGAHPYTGPVAVLTSSGSMSAAETLTQALMNRTPRPSRIGAPTQGIFSDTLDRALPNGWMFGLPNERYLDGDGRSYDGAGIPPDLTVPVFTDDELAHGRDSALAAARAVLANPIPR